MADRLSSLQQVHPMRFDVPVVTVVSGILLGWALTMPALVIQVRTPEATMLPPMVPVQEEVYSVLTSIAKLRDQGHNFWAIAIFCFSIVFPYAKLAAILAVWFIPCNRKWRSRFLHIVGGVGKWSMLDVFVVALFIVITTATHWLSAQPRAGVYLFAAAIALSMVLTMYIEYLAKHDEGVAEGTEARRHEGTK